VTEAHIQSAEQIPAQSATETGCQEKPVLPAETQKAVAGNGFLPKSIPVRTYNYPQGDSNQAHISPQKQGFLDQRGTESGTVTDADRVAALAAQLGRLSPADRARLAALLLGQQEAPAQADRPEVQ
jgi:hypothetical protein